MATSLIEIADYAPAEGENKANTVTVVEKFNNNVVLVQCKKYIGTTRTCNRDLIKRVGSGIPGAIYTVHLGILKKVGKDVKVTYEFLDPEDASIIVSKQSYATVEEFEADMSYINEQIERLFA